MPAVPHSFPILATSDGTKQTLNFFLPASVSERCQGVLLSHFGGHGRKFPTMKTIIILIINLIVFSLSLPGAEAKRRRLEKDYQKEWCEQQQRKQQEVARIVGELRQVPPTPEERIAALEQKIQALEKRLRLLEAALSKEKVVSEVRKTLEQQGTDVNLADKNGETPIMKKALLGQVGEVQALIEAGADVNAVDKDRETALIKAARSGYVDVVRVLLEHGADVNAEDKDGRTVLMWTAYKGHIEVAELLLEHGADVNAKDKEGSMALGLLEYTNKTEMIEFLKSVGATAE